MHICILRSQTNIRITVVVTNELWRALYMLANIRECSLAKPLFEKIRLDNVTIQWRSLEAETAVELNKPGKGQ